MSIILYNTIHINHLYDLQKRDNMYNSIQKRSRLLAEQEKYIVLYYIVERYDLCLNSIDLLWKMMRYTALENFVLLNKRQSKSKRIELIREEEAQKRIFHNMKETNKQ